MSDRQRVRREFHGAGSGSAELTWGQRYIWNALGSLGGSPHYLNLVRMLPVPPDAALERVADAVAAVAARHESLRSRFLTGQDGHPYQQVDADGTIEVDVWEAGENGAALLADEVYTDHFGHVFDLADGLPVRVSVITEHGVPRRVLFGLTHLAADRWGIEVATRDLRALMAGRTPATEPGLTPREQAATQHGSAGERRNAAAVRWWRSRLETVPPAMFTRGGEPSTTWTRAAELRSPAAALASDELARRWGSSPSRVVLAALATTLRQCTGLPSVALQLLAGNRFDPATRESVSTQVQAGLFVVEPDETSFAATVARTDAAAMRTYRYSAYRPDDLDAAVRAVSEERGVPIELDCFFQDGTTRANQTTASDGEIDGERVRAALDRSTFRWHLNWLPWRRFSWFSSRERDALLLQLTADPACVPRELSESIVRGVETLLVASVHEGEKTHA
jgi:hypothetical protein